MPNAYARPKNLLDERVLARLRSYDDADRRINHGGYASSGSEHDGYSGLSGFIDGFFVDDDDGSSSRTFEVRENASDEEEEESSDDRRDSFRLSSAAMVRDLMNRPGNDRFRTDLVTTVRNAVELCADLRKNNNKSVFRRAVMGSLRESGYNAGICKSKWDSTASGGLTAGSYEYIDVVNPCSEERYIVDLEFAAEFEIARATDEYKAVVDGLSTVFVGKAEELKKLVRILTEALKRSMRAREIHLPPWRKGRYLQAKWLGPYKRTTNLTATSAASAQVPPVTTAMVALAPPSSLVQCRAVGFVPAEKVIVPTPIMR